MNLIYVSSHARVTSPKSETVRDPCQLSGGNMIQRQLREPLFANLHKLVPHHKTMDSSLVSNRLTQGQLSEPVLVGPHNPMLHQKDYKSTTNLEVV